MKPIAYIAGRYTADTRAMTDLNIQAAKHCALILFEKGYFPLTPHLNTAHFDDYVGMPVEFYYEHYIHIMKKCADIVVCVQGYKESEGALGEIEASEKQPGIRIYYSVDDVPVAVNNGL